jgi:hypothetical protein
MLSWLLGFRNSAGKDFRFGYHGTIMKRFGFVNRRLTAWILSKYIAAS